MNGDTASCNSTDYLFTEQGLRGHCLVATQKVRRIGGSEDRWLQVRQCRISFLFELSQNGRTPQTLSKRWWVGSFWIRLRQLGLRMLTVEKRLGFSAFTTVCKSVLNWNVIRQAGLRIIRISLSAKSLGGQPSIWTLPRELVLWLLQQWQRNGFSFLKGQEIEVSSN